MDGVTKTAAQFFFQNSLHEVIRKLRSAPSGKEDETIEFYIRETKKEVGSTIQSVKVGAIQKAAYFHMIGYDSSYANFNVVEVMADPSFGSKRIGYMAASAMFNESTDVIPLVTALLKRDLCSSNQYESGMALYCIASICNPDLAKDLVVDVVNLLQHPRTYVRKKAVLSLYKIFLQYPDSLRPTYAKLKDKLEDSNENSDSDTAVRGAVVCIFCELARRNPANFLGLAVPFFSLLSNIHNNWNLIKVVKVFGYFVPLEPRLGKKLAEPLANLIETTSAKSVQYECLLSVANGMTKVNSLTKLAGEKLMGFIEDQDQNLKFLGLHALKKLAFGNPKLLQGSLEKIIKCLDDKDITIRSEALSILTFLVSPDNIVRIVDFILDRCSVGVPDEDWLNLVVETVVEMCKTDDYSGIEDFEWYFSVLLDLALLPLSVFRHGALVENEMVIITTRVNGVRSYAVDSLHEILNSSQLLNSDSRLSTQSKILKAAAFVCGEYPHWLKNKLETVTLLLGESIASLPADVQCACVVAAGKIAAFCRVPCKRHSNLLNGEEGDLPVDESTENVIPWLTGESKGLEKFIQSMHPDVQERANFAYFSVSKCEDAGSALYENELVTVAEGSQKLLDVPDELCLDTPFCADASKLLDLTDSEDSDNAASSEDNFEFEYRIEQEALRERKRREEVDPFYLKEGSTTQETEATKEDQTTSHRRYRKDRQSQKKTYTIKRDLHQPDHPETLATKKGRNAMANEIDDATIKFSNIDLTQGVGADEVLRGTAGRTDFTKKEKKKAVPTRKFETIFDANHLTLRVACVSCKCKKDGFHLKHMVEVSNNGKHSVLNVALATDAEDDCAESNILFSDNSSGDNVLQSSSQLTERVVAGACERHEVDIVIVKLPESFVDPVLLWVAFEIEGSVKKEKASLQLACVDFLGEDVPIPSSEEFLSVAGGPLSSALVLSAFLECNNDQISEGTATLQSRLHLQLVDIFNDCATLVGRVHCRKANSDTAWVAVLLRVADQEGAHGVSIHVKSLFACVSEGLIYEIVNIIGNTISQ